jgi:hypothetical protein
VLQSTATERGQRDKNDAGRQPLTAADRFLHVRPHGRGNVTHHANMDTGENEDPTGVAAATRLGSETTPGAAVPR